MSAPLPADVFPLLRGFASTRWTAVRAAARNDAEARTAREELCRDYWYPVYAYLQKLGYRHTSGNLAQDFLASVLKRDGLSQADPRLGKFRSFLLSALNRFLAEASGSSPARKRSGAYLCVPANLDPTGSRLARSRSRSADPAETYETEWAAAIVSNALRNLQGEYAAANEQSQYQKLKIFLRQADNPSRYQAIAGETKCTPAGVQAQVNRLRQRYGHLLRAEIGRTVAVPDQTEGEIQHLREVLAIVAG